MISLVLKMREFPVRAKAENWDCTVDASQASSYAENMGRFKMGRTSYKNEKKRRIYRKMGSLPLFFPFTFRDSLQKVLPL